MTYVVGQIVLQVKAGAPNNGRGDGNVSMVKQFRAGRDTYPYVSAQACRRWIRDSLPASETASPVLRSGKGAKQQAYTSGRPDQYLDDDLFGYMIAVKADTSGAKESKTFMRDTVFATGTLVAVVPNPPVIDFGTMSRGFGSEENPVIHEHQMYTADLAGDILLDLPRVGTFELGSSIGKAALSPTVATELLAGSAHKTALRGVDCARLPIEQRRHRVAVLLRTIAEMRGGAKQALHYGDRTPALVILAPMLGGINPFTRIVRNRGGQTHVDADILRTELDAWADQLDGPVRIGWAPGFLGEQRDNVRNDLTDLLDSGRVLFDHPRTVLRALADEFVAGDHDHWFEDPTA
ncbi:type I-B CRISPR-associated protein Cas7/Cst2/DevR [Nocardia alni]|uniref:type I-B CRISPR-associated protein Cas7/Cst2/DevR n=1 Tax=Nocardia alni TaxID=2815723 RepID=UPI001C22C850|nr:type I-B CRISPR-associated protein Cas7/Cst2/DevR [Nocardia alni]